MRTMTTEKLLKGMPVLQTQIDTLLEFDVRLETASAWRSVMVSRHRHGAVLVLFSGSPQGAEQRHHQCCLSAALQGPGQTVRLLQRRHHQPFRLVVVHLQLEDASVRAATCNFTLQRSTSRWRRVTARRPWRSTRGSWPGWQRLGNSWSLQRWETTLLSPGHEKDWRSTKLFSFLLQTVGVDKNDIPDINYVSQHA